MLYLILPSYITLKIKKVFISGKIAGPIPGLYVYGKSDDTRYTYFTVKSSLVACL